MTGNNAHLGTAYCALLTPALAQTGWNPAENPSRVPPPQAPSVRGTPQPPPDATAYKAFYFAEFADEKTCDNAAAKNFRGDVAKRTSALIGCRDAAQGLPSRVGR